MKKGKGIAVPADKIGTYEERERKSHVRLFFKELNHVAGRNGKGKKYGPNR